MRYDVDQTRTPEIGIRLAMGAQPALIVALLLGQGFRLLGVGMAIGFTGALVGTRYIEALLFGVTTTDPLTFIIGCVVLAILPPQPKAFRFPGTVAVVLPRSGCVPRYVPRRSVLTLLANSKAY